MTTECSLTCLAPWLPGATTYCWLKLVAFRTYLYVMYDYGTSQQNPTICHAVASLLQISGDESLRPHHSDVLLVGWTTAAEESWCTAGIGQRQCFGSWERRCETSSVTARTLSKVSAKYSVAWLVNYRYIWQCNMQCSYAFCFVFNNVC